MLVQDWFDPHNLEHLKAYQHLVNKGFWPEGFIPKNVYCNGLWSIALIAKMANEWLDLKLNP